MNTHLEEDLLIEDSIATCLTNYATNPEVYHRQMYGRIALKVLHQPIERIMRDIHTFISTLLMISEDNEATVRATFLTDIPDILQKCADREWPQLKDCLHDRLLDIVLRYLEDSDSHVRKNAFFVITHLLEKKYFLDTDCVQFTICPAVLKLTQLNAKTQMAVDFNTNAIELMGMIAPRIGPQRTGEIFLERFLEFCTDDVYFMRKSCADYLPIFCQVMGTEVTELKLLPIFLKLCEDSVWSVRKSAAKSLPKVALMCSLECRRDPLAPVAYKLMNDPYRWVSMAAFKNLGTFIATFAQPSVTGLDYTPQGELYIKNMAYDEIVMETDQMDYANQFDNLTFRSSMDKIIPNQKRDGGKPTEKCSLTDDTNENPFKWFLAPEPTATNTPTTTPHQLLTMNLQKFPFYRELFEYNRNSLQSPTSASFSSLSTPIISLSKDQYEESEIDDTPSSSGCSSQNSYNMDMFDNDSGISFNNRPKQDNLILRIVRKFNEKRDTDATKEKVNDFVYSDQPQPQLESNDNEQKNDDNKQESELSTSSSNLNDSGDEIFDNLNELQFDAAINAMQYEDDFEQSLPDYESTPFGKDLQPLDMFEEQYGLTGMNGGGADAGNGNDEQMTNAETGEHDIDNLCQEFNSANFWYVKPPHIAIDLNGLLETSNRLVEERNAKNKAANNNEWEDEKPIDTYEKIKCDYVNGNYDSLSDVPVDLNDQLRKHKLEHIQRICVGPYAPESQSTFNQSIVPPYLIEYFVSMVSFKDTDLNLYCVYNFPAVALTLGKEHWRFVEDLLLVLCKDMQWKIRKTIAGFIYQIALIIGQELANVSLVPIFTSFFKDLDEVKIAALRNLPNFLKIIDINEHPKIMISLSDCYRTDNDANWRFRAEFAKQLKYVLEVYGHIYPIDCTVYITGMVVMLLTDKVQTVREIALRAIVAKFRSCTQSEEDHLTNLFVDEFAHHPQWRRRQMFVALCSLLIRCEAISRDSFSNKLYNHCIALAYDKVPNIRLVTGTFLVQLWNRVYFRRADIDSNRLLVNTIAVLQEDVDDDVQYRAKQTVRLPEETLDQPPLAAVQMKYV